MSTDPVYSMPSSSGRGAPPLTPENLGPRLAELPTVFLQPIAAPSILGLFGFSAATFIVGANMAGWFGTLASNVYIAPYAATFGGIAQLLAGMWAFKARDGLATAVHGMWGSFWIAYGILFTLVGVGAIAAPGAKMPALGFWFITLAVITWLCMWVSLGEYKSMAWVLGLLALGSSFAALAFLTGAAGWRISAGWLLVASAVVAWYTAAGIMAYTMYNKEIWPLGMRPREKAAPKLAFGFGEPGVKRGQ